MCFLKYFFLERQIERDAGESSNKHGRQTKLGEVEHKEIDDAMGLHSTWSSSIMHGEWFSFLVITLLSAAAVAAAFLGSYPPLGKNISVNLFTFGHEY